jgi:hypothetical protein
MPGSEIVLLNKWETATSAVVLRWSAIADGFDLLPARLELAMAAIAAGPPGPASLASPTPELLQLRRREI